MGTSTVSGPFRSENGFEQLVDGEWVPVSGGGSSLSLTTTGTSGPATLVGSNLNIPNYATGGGGGSVTQYITTMGLPGGGYAYLNLPLPTTATVGDTYEIIIQPTLLQNGVNTAVEIGFDGYPGNAAFIGGVQTIVAVGSLVASGAVYAGSFVLINTPATPVSSYELASGRVTITYIGLIELVPESGYFNHIYVVTGSYTQDYVG
jgi:hypothetical protein